MITVNHIKGMLLEEAILHLLQRSGYSTVNEPASDPTLDRVGAGLAVRGRGSLHQIDAIADFVVHQPFSNPQRLLVEAKCYSQKIGVEVIRNAIGVIKDVSEFWVADRDLVSRRSRYHYQYAVFSASMFSIDAQRYAFAQDVYLFPLSRSRYFKPILEAIQNAVPLSFIRFSRAIQSVGKLSELRKVVRRSLRSESIENDMPEWIHEADINIKPFIDACKELNYGLVAVLGGRFPIFLSPNQSIRSRRLEDQMRVRIYWNRTGWYLKSRDEESLFSFDLPDELFRLYADEGFLTASRALDLKVEMMSSFQVVERQNEQTRIINFSLDLNWIEELRRRGEDSI